MNVTALPFYTSVKPHVVTYRKRVGVIFIISTVETLKHALIILSKGKNINNKTPKYRVSGSE
jgi:hypothetical protein